jgi:methyl-accepting chemotaxis protein
MVQEPSKYSAQSSRPDHTSGSNPTQAVIPPAASPVSAQEQPLRSNGKGLPYERVKGAVAQPKALLKQLLRLQGGGLSIKTKATALAVTLGVVPVLVVGGIAIYFANQIITESTLKERQRIAVGMSLQLNQFIQNRLNDVESIARAPVSTHTDIRNITPPDVIKQYLDGYIEQDATYEQIAAITPEGGYGFLNEKRDAETLFKTTSGEVEPQDYALGAKPFAVENAPYYFAVRNTQKPVIIPLQVSPQTGKSFFYIAAPAFEAASGKLAYIIYSQTDSTAIARVANEFLTNLLYKGGAGTQQASPEFKIVDHGVAYFEKTPDGKTAEVESRRIVTTGGAVQIDGKPFQPGGNIFVKENRVVVAKTGESVGAEMQSIFPKYTELRNKGVAMTTTDVSRQNGQEYLLSYAPIAQVKGVYLDWGILLYEPTATVFAFRQPLLLSLSVGTGVAALLIGLIAAALANRATRPLIAASEAVDKIGQGNLNTRLNVQGSDEIAVLGTNINHMAAQLQQSLEAQALESTKERILTAAKGSGALRQADLKDIFEQAVVAVHDLLRCDRVVIYRFEHGTDAGVVAESVNRGWPSAIEQQVSDICIPESVREAYQNGRVTALSNVSQAELHSEHAKLLESLMVQSILVVPMAGGDRLFGLLIAHSCFSIRQWQEAEINFFKRLGTELGLATYRVTLLEETEKLAKEQRQLTEALQSRALELLQEVEPIGKGDLTIRARVTADEIGTIADSYNATVDNLRKLVIQVKDAVNQVVETTRVNDESIQTLSIEASRQVNEITIALERVEAVVAAVRDVATNAKQAENVMQQAAQKIAVGDAAIDQIVSGNEMIRETVAETTKKVEHLIESSRQISAIVN